MSSDTLTAAEIWEKIDGEHVCMFVDQTGEGDLPVRARPMSPIARREEGLIWFVTERASGKVREIADDGPVMLVYQNTGANFYLTLEGSAAIVDDKAKVRALWNPFMKEFFEGPDDPRIILIAVTPLGGDYWTGPGRIVGGLKMLFTAATGVKTDIGTQGRVRM